MRLACPSPSCSSASAPGPSSGHFEAAAGPVKLPKPLSAEPEAFGFSLDRTLPLPPCSGFLLVPKGPDWRGLEQRKETTMSDTPTNQNRATPCDKDSPIIVITIRGGMVEDVGTTVPVRVIIEDWDCPDWDSGKRPSREVYWNSATLSNSCAEEKFRHLTNEADSTTDAADHRITLARPAVAQTGSDRPVVMKEHFDIEALASRRQIAVTWDVEDVLAVRPDLTDDQAWEVLKSVKRGHDANRGISWDTLEWTAMYLFGNAPETNEE
jgi:hypothetical protein